MICYLNIKPLPNKVYSERNMNNITNGAHTHIYMGNCAKFFSLYFAYLFWVQLKLAHIHRLKVVVCVYLKLEQLNPFTRLLLFQQSSFYSFNHIIDFFSCTHQMWNNWIVNHCIWDRMRENNRGRLGWSIMCKWSIWLFQLDRFLPFKYTNMFRPT